MKQLIILFLFIIPIINAHSQCKSGNCINGNGIMDFGWCVYEGGFINSKPDGHGTMKYDDYTYSGDFKNGAENGDGVITYKDGRKESVHYLNGQKVEGPIKVSPGEYKPLNPQPPNCISGDCINGFGTYKWSNGDKFTGNWKESNKVEGNYYFADGAVYTGTYNADGKEFNGQVTIGSRTIPFVKGLAIIPPPDIPKNEENNSEPKLRVTRTAIYGTCLYCHGTCTQELSTNNTYQRYDSYGNKNGISNYKTITCSYCHGTGR